MNTGPAAFAQAEPSLDAARRDVDNELLRRMDAADFARLQPYLERVPLQIGTLIAAAGSPIDVVCFPEGGIVEFADVLQDGRRLAVGLVGREGFVGWPLLMGADRWSYEAVVRAENGTALRLKSDQLREAASASLGLQTLLLRYAHSFVAQMGRTIVSNLIHPVVRRTARWLLLYHDRVGSDELTVTHEELGIMLGVRRSSITDALHQLEGERAIRGRRGKILVRDRACLEALAADTYGFAEAEYRRLVAPDRPA